MRDSKMTTKGLAGRKPTQGYEWAQLSSFEYSVFISLTLGFGSQDQLDRPTLNIVERCPKSEDTFFIGLCQIAVFWNGFTAIQKNSVTLGRTIRIKHVLDAKMMGEFCRLSKNLFICVRNCTRVCTQ